MKQRAMDATRLVDRVLSAFDDASVRWVLLRGRAGLGVTGHDVDLLVAGDDLPSAEDVVLDAGAIRLPGSTHPWHRFYLVEDPGDGGPVVFDIVTELIYNRDLRLHSGLETTCLENRKRDGALWVLDPTDMFWTVLLHCLLDKETVTERRRAELGAVVETVSRPSAGEVFFAAHAPAGWSATRPLEAVAAEDWDAVSLLGQLMRTELASDDQPSVTGGAQAKRRPTRRAAPERLLRSVARAAYPLWWRRAGMGVTPRVLDLAETAGIDGLVVHLQRRPWLRDVELLVPDERSPRLRESLGRERYRRVPGRWVRADSTGIEVVRVLTPHTVGFSEELAADLRSMSSPMPGRVRCRRASAATTLLVASATASAGRPARRRVPQVRAASTDAWAEAEQLARKHGLVDLLEFLTHGPQTLTGARRPGRPTTSVLRRKGTGPVRVSFSGLDGAGKSSQIESLAAAVAAEGLAVEVVWLPTRVWPEPLLNKLPPGFRSHLGPKRTRRTGQPGQAAGEPAPAAATKVVRTAMWSMIAMSAAVSVGLSLRRRASSSTADVLLLDRYRLDTLVKLESWYPDVPARWLVRVVKALAPPPDLELLLRVDPEVALARKSEQWTLAQLTRQSRLYDDLALDGGHVLTLDGQRAEADLAREVRARVEAALHEC